MPGTQSAGILQIVRLGDRQAAGLCELLEALAAAGESHRFRPHPSDRDHIDELALQHGSDLHYVALLDDRVAGYGLLRGWDEGYEVPSLGIAVHPRFRGLQLGDMLMHFLHAAARLRGCGRIRLRVVADNAVAIRLYERTGYVFEPVAEIGPAGERLLVAYKDLSR